jgi:thiol-disulfide isomerase/thioredoxin
MVKITEILNNVYKPYKRTILIVVAVIAFLLIAVYIYKKVFVSMIEKKDTNNVSNANRRVNNADIFFFNASWCPHCTKAMPAWKDFVSSYDQTVLNGYTINCIGGEDGVDCSSRDDAKSMEIVHEFGVEQFPTIKMVKDKTTIDFDAKITQENLTKFVNSVL